VSPGPAPHRRTLSRRSVFRGAFWLLAAPVAAAFASLVSRYDRAARRPRRLVVPLDPPEAVKFVDGVIVCRSAEGVRVFAARCTHLGCRITAMSGGLLVCPCHGSTFRTDGSVASGPASRPLERLPFHIDPRTGGLVVDVA
jgi:nitrite reductase/ring-hydroxylating ferredoxin subunit